MLRLKSEWYQGISIKRILLLLLTFLSFIFLIWKEVEHYQNYTDFFSLGVHMDLLHEQANIGIPGIGAMYSAQITNFWPFPLEFEGCKVPNDVSPFYEIEFRYQIEKWDDKLHSWRELIAPPSNACTNSGYDLIKYRLWPGQSLMLVDWEATAARDGLRKGDWARFVAFKSFSKSRNDFAQSLYRFRPFRIEEERIDDQIQYRVRH